jgi:hypothetical protein
MFAMAISNSFSGSDTSTVPRRHALQCLADLIPFQNIAEMHRLSTPLLLVVVVMLLISPASASQGEECPWGCNDYDTLLGGPVCHCRRTETCLKEAQWNGHTVGKCISNGKKCEYMCVSGEGVGGMARVPAYFGDHGRWPLLVSGFVSGS